MSISEHRELKIMYYKSDSTEEGFTQHLDQHLFQNLKKYDFQKTKHTSGLFLRIKRKGLIGLLANNYEIIFSQRKHHTLIAVEHYQPVIIRYYRFVVLFVFILLAFVISPRLTEGYLILDVFKTVSLGIVFVLESILLINNKMEDRNIYQLFNIQGSSLEKIKADEYRRLLGDDI